MNRCFGSFVAGVLTTISLGGLILAQADPPKAAPPPPPAPPIVISPDYERVTALIAVLEARVSTRPPKPAMPHPSAEEEAAALEEVVNLLLPDPEPAPRVLVSRGSTPAGYAYIAPAGTDVREARITTIRSEPRSFFAAPSRVAENGSYYGQPNTNGVPKTVYVNGYYRRDGTYVRGHYRSPPGSNR